MSEDKKEKRNKKSREKAAGGRIFGRKEEKERMGNRT